MIADLFSCSNCGCVMLRDAAGKATIVYGRLAYCPNCGARVEGVR